MQSTLTSKGQITIPAAMRRKMRLKAGDVLTVQVTKKGRPAGEKINIKGMRSPLGRMKKSLEGKTVDQWMEYLRGPVELP
jgi:AbrB family looped-hinge helix DNA binding protein